ncbi:MAG: hypothetical protein ACI9DG_001077 [Oleispira sp.]
MPERLAKKPFDKRKSEMVEERMQKVLGTYGANSMKKTHLSNLLGEVRCELGVNAHGLCCCAKGGTNYCPLVWQSRLQMFVHPDSPR